MTKEQFNKWKDGYFDAFPDTLAWLNKCPNPAATLATWYQCLSRCEFADVLSVTAKLIMGDLQPLEAYQREQTALHIRAFAGRMADDRNKRAKADRERTENAIKSRGFRPFGPSMGSMFKEICKYREEGESQGLVGVALSEYASNRLDGFIKQHGREIADRIEPENDDE